MRIHLCTENTCPIEDKETAEKLNGFLTNYTNMNIKEKILKNYKELPRTKHAPNFEDTHCISDVIVEKFLTASIDEVINATLDSIELPEGFDNWTDEAYDNGFNNCLEYVKEAIQKLKQ